MGPQGPKDLRPAEAEGTPGALFTYSLVAFTPELEGITT